MMNFVCKVDWFQGEIFFLWLFFTNKNQPKIIKYNLFITKETQGPGRSTEPWKTVKLTALIF